MTLGDHRPLVPYLINKGGQLTDLYRNLILKGPIHPVLRKTFEWLEDQISSEWFESVEEAVLYLKDPKNNADFFGDNMFVKLNFAFTAYLLLHPGQYEAYYQQIEEDVCRLLPNEPKNIIHEIVKLCREQSFLYRCLHGDKSSNTSVKLSQPTLKALKECGYLDPDYLIESENIVLNLNEVTANGILDSLESKNGQPSVFDLTQIMQTYTRRFQMNPLSDSLVAAVAKSA